MHTPKASFGPETIALMEEVCDAAWCLLEATTSSISPAEAHKIRSQMAIRVMDAVAAGERDPEELKVIALNLRQG